MINVNEIAIRKYETPADYRNRLCKNRAAYGLSWVDIANLINPLSGKNYTEDAYRKWWSRNRDNVVSESNNCPVHTPDTETKTKKEEVHSSLESKSIEIAKEIVKMRDQRREYNKLICAEARKENFYDIICDTIKSLEPYKYHVDVSCDTGEYDNDVLEGYNDLFVSLNDIHYGANISNAWNVYNPDVAKKRLEKYLSYILNVRNTHQAKNCYVCVNGDLISGRIHNTIEIANCENVVNQIIGVSELLSSFLNELCDNFSHVYLSVVAGNHSRISKKKQDAPKDERLDNLIPWYIGARIVRSNFSIIPNHVDSTLNIVNIRGYNYLNVHGDYDNFSNILKLIKMIPNNIYCVHFGHMHHNAMDYIQGYKVIMSGSLMGMDDYCIENRIYGIAQQMIGVCNTSGIVCTYDVNLQ